ncbi:MAG TPA: DUF1778 domain-containing protein [Solirubrobacterales bacterium]|nr:DUF1778 domain-containing protein [Solirubrobacterales bacterium]
MASRTGETRERRWNLRVEDSEDEMVRAASDIAETSYSNFVRGAAVSEARRILADRSQFKLDPDKWQEFNALLDRPPRIPAGLRDLFSKPSVFE